MKKIIYLCCLAFLVLSVSTDQLKPPKILIIGDSISIGYTPYVKKYFTDRATIIHNPGNAQHTGTGLAKIEAWLGNEEWDVIQFNWGLWDLCYRHPDATVYGNRDKERGKITFSIEEYAANLDSLVVFLQQHTRAKLIFVTTTYVPTEEAGRFKKDPMRYNKAAKKIMAKHDITIHDVYRKSKRIHRELGKGMADVHYTEAGYEQLGALVADFLEKEIEW